MNNGTTPIIMSDVPGSHEMASDGDPPPPPSDGAPTPSEPRVRKRRRRTMACTQCRSRKLRCDREYPTCGRCRKSKTANRCTYEDGFLWQQPKTVPSTVFSDRLPSTGASGTTGRGEDQPPDSGIRVLPTPLPRPHQQQRQSSVPTPQHPPVTVVEERRDRFLETVLGAPPASFDQESYGTEPSRRPGRVLGDGGAPSQHSSGDGSLSPSQPLHMAPRIMMRGKDTKTRFNGQGVFANIVSQFTDLKSFAEELKQSNPNLALLRPDLERVKRGLYKRTLREPISEPGTISLIQMIPSRCAVDELIGLYFTYVEPVHRLFHAPTFFREFEEFWAKRDSPDLVSPTFAVTLLLVLACAWNLADPEVLFHRNGGSMDCSTAVKWVLHAEKWIQTAKIKRPEITSLRIHCLLIMAQTAHGMKRSKAWLATGTLVKQAMVAGYHRDPSRYAKISVFHKEMRRRMWATIVELDLQIALDRGMPPSVQATDYDTGPVSNLNDTDFSEKSVELPAGRSLSEVTDSSLQVILSQSLPLRLKVCALVHSPRITCRYEDILRMDWEFERCLSAIPSWFTSHTGDPRAADHRALLVKASIETKIAQARLCLHTPFGIEATNEPLFMPSARTRLDVATTILSTQKRLSELSRQLSLCNIGDWTIQACGTIGEILYGSRDGHSPNLIRSLPGLPESLLSLVETVVLSLEARLQLVIKGAKDYFFMSTILALVKARLWPEQANVFKQQVIERVLTFAQTLYTRHASCHHLGGASGMGSSRLTPNSGPRLGSTVPSPVPAPDFEGVIHSGNVGGIAPPSELDVFLDVFDWEDLTGVDFVEQ